MSSKRVINPLEFVDEVNKRLPFDRFYQPGMRIKLVPAHSTALEATGFDFEGPSSTSVVAARVEAEVLGEYIVDPWPGI
jgi:hypothetical protein